ncbi:bifunctional Mta/Sah nucleosidase Mtn [Mycobacteroides abscessus subsp. massiliense]|nr:bifunctional Mta/Sah nucleosidase Mtn [Mycobacteroides abscessus subsp. massiliense]
MLLEKFNPEVVINTGSAGALDQTLSIGDILVSNHVLYHDANATAFGYEFGQIPQMPKTYTTDPTLLKNKAALSSSETVSLLVESL